MGTVSEKYPYDPPVPPFADSDPYELAVRSQAGAEGILDRLGALDEIRDAILAHCELNRPLPPYDPEALKKLLRPRGWASEARVPPFDAVCDGMSINERYDALKFFDVEGAEVGVAIEMNDWKVHRELLKFRRGFERRQIAVGAIIQPNYRETHYCFEHFRHVNEPLFGHIPVLYCCPRGPGLEERPFEIASTGHI
jgi:hypothetical protein